MPLLGFTKMLDKLLDGSKTQTIRKPRKHPIRLGDKLYIYWRLRTKHTHKLGEGMVTKIEPKQFCRITAHDFQLDGFDIGDLLTDTLLSLSYVVAESGFEKAIRAFQGIHPELKDPYYWGIIFNIITWEWTDGPHPPQQEAEN